MEWCDCNEWCETCEWCEWCEWMLWSDCRSASGPPCALSTDSSTQETALASSSAFFRGDLVDLMIPPSASAA